MAQRSVRMYRMLSRASLFEHELALRRSTRVEIHPFGKIFLHDELPLVHDLNRAIAEPDGDPTTTLHVTEATLKAAGRHPRLDVIAPSCSVPLRSAAHAAGWNDDEWAVMARDTQIEGVAPAEQLGWEEVCAFDEMMIVEEPYGSDPEVRRQLVERTRIAERVAQARAYARKEDGRIVPMARMYAIDETACIDSVDTIAEYRRRGHARATVLASIAAAAREGADTVFLTVEPDNDGAVRLYDSLGFERIGCIHQMSR